MAQRLDTATRAEVLPGLDASGWRAVEGRDALRKILKFRNFSEAWAFMARVALLAEKLDHHPEWKNVYNVVDLVLTTHSCGGLSELDLDLARRIDRITGTAEVQTDHSRPALALCQIRAEG